MASIADRFEIIQTTFCRFHLRESIAFVVDQVGWPTLIPRTTRGRHDRGIAAELALARRAVRCSSRRQQRRNFRMARSSSLSDVFERDDVLITPFLIPPFTCAAQGSFLF